MAVRNGNQCGRSVVSMRLCRSCASASYRLLRVLAAASLVLVIAGCATYSTKISELRPQLADGAYDSWWDRLKLDYAPSSYQHKLRTRWRQDLRAGALVYHGFGSVDQPDVWKFNVTLRNKSIGPVHFDNTILGNYQVAFGQGLVMQNTDFFKSRNSGFGWDKR